MIFISIFITIYFLNIFEKCFLFLAYLFLFNLHEFSISFPIFMQTFHI